MPTATFSVSYWRALRRVFTWLFAIWSFLWGNFWDRLQRKSSVARKADRLRHIFENSGSTFKKIGRLLAMRIDLLPWAYCVELSKIVDKMDPFPLENAINSIEHAIGQPIQKIFQQFDPQPIVSSTEANVYQAILDGGQMVAVKVRRPGIGETFMADLKALDWILDISEFLSILRSGFTKNLQRELRESILDELNFLLEARHQALFREEARNSGKKFFTSPNVYFEFCSQEVIVQDFTPGMWLWELMAAVEKNDQDALARAVELNIDPRLVARRLMWVNFWGLDEHLLFRADLHPDNVIIQANSKLTFVDFSVVGALSQEKRQAMQQAMLAAWRRDPLEMAQASLVLLEPLPPIDTISFIKDLENSYWQFLYALESKHIQWWERTSARMWLGFVRVTREHNITMNINVLRLIRACLLNDTIAARLCHKIDHTREYQKFTRYRAKQARKRVEASINEQFQRGIDGRVYLQFENIVDTSERLLHQIQRLTSTPVIKFNAALDKSVYSLSILFRMLFQIVIATLIGAGMYMGRSWLNHAGPQKFIQTLSLLITNQFFWLAILFLVIINVRTIMFRLGDKDV